MPKRPAAICLLTIITCLSVSRFGTANQQTPQAKVSGNYQVASTGDSAVLLDTRTGDTWLLQVDNGPTWAPIPRPEEKKVPTTRKTPTGQSPELMKRLVDAQLALSKLRDTYGARHPRVREKEREVATLRQVLER